MSAEGPARPNPEPEASPALTDIELAVLRFLEKEGPMNAIEIAANTARDVDEVLEALHKLRDRGLVDRAEPDPADVRFSLDTEALGKVLA